MYIGLYVQCRYVYRSVCTVPLCISVCMYSAVMYIGLYVQCRLFLLEFNETGILSTDFQKIRKYRISWKSVQCEPSCSVRTDRRTDRHDEVNIHLSQLYERA